MTANDVDLNAWLQGLGFHPANTEVKQLGHEAARRLVAELGVTLHQILPPGKDKSIAFTALEDVVMRANRALATNGGPNEHVTANQLNLVLDRLTTELPEDPRIGEYKDAQLTLEDAADTARTRTEEAAAEPVVLGGEPDYPDMNQVRFTNRGTSTAIEGVLSYRPGNEYFQLGVVCTDPIQLAEVVDMQEFNGFYLSFDSKDEAEEFAACVLTASNAVFNDIRAAHAATDSCRAELSATEEFRAALKDAELTAEASQTGILRRTGL